MCRFVLYLGEPITLDRLITRPRNSIIHQSYHAEHREEPLNGDGFGLAWYAPRHSMVPALFRSVQPAWNDANLANLARVTESPAILAHVRAATPGLPVTLSNCHPFVCCGLAFCHNGHVADFLRVKRALRTRLSDEAYLKIDGSTDSEHIFALFTDHHANVAIGRHPPAVALREAMRRTIVDVVSMARSAGRPTEPHQLNLAVTDGKAAVASRFTNDPTATANSLYVHAGRRYVCEDDDGSAAATRKAMRTSGVGRLVHPEGGGGAVLIASEPLSDDDTWHEVPEATFVSVDSDLNVEYTAIEL